MMEIAENTEGIPGIKEFPKKRLWDPYIPYKSDPTIVLSVDTIKKNIMEILDILRFPDSYTSLSNILHAYGNSFDTALNELVEEKKIIKNVSIIKTKKGQKRFLTYHLSNYSSLEKVQKKTDFSEIRGKSYYDLNLRTISEDVSQNVIPDSKAIRISQQEYKIIRAKKAGKVSSEKRYTTEHIESMKKFRSLSDKELIDRIWNDKCVKMIAKDYKISDRMVAKICYERLMPTPPTGYYNMSVKEQEEIKTGFFSIIKSLESFSNQYISKSAIATFSNVKIEFIDKWINKTSLSKIISIKEDSYRLNERRVIRDDLIKNEILHALSLVDDAKSITFLIKNGNIHRKPETIKPILENLKDEKIVEKSGSESRSLYRLIRNDN